MRLKIRCALQHAPTIKPDLRAFHFRAAAGGVIRGGRFGVGVIRFDFCLCWIDHISSASPEPILWFLSCGCKKGTPPAGCHVRNRKCLTTPPAFCPDKKPPPLTRGGMGALRTRRGSPCIRGREWRASGKGRRGRRPLRGCGGNGTMPS